MTLDTHTAAQANPSSELAQLKTMTTIVADTGDIDTIARLKPSEATTNPSLILKAASSGRYDQLLDAARAVDEAPELRIDRVLVGFGSAILEHIAGRVSTEVDARLSFNWRATVEKARRLIALYEAQGIDRSRVLIKIAATWQGCQAARVLEAEGIHCNMTLIFSTAQAVASAQAGATLISPFVGRIYDWFKAAEGPNWDERAMAGANDPGVQSVRAIYKTLKAAPRSWAPPLETRARSWRLRAAICSRCRLRSSPSSTRARAPSCARSRRPRPQRSPFRSPSPSSTLP